MIYQQDVINYFEDLAGKHKQLLNNSPGKKAFFFIPVTYNLAEIDSAIKNLKIAPFLMLDAMRGQLDDNTNESHTNNIQIQFSVLDMATIGDAVTLRDVRDKCLKIGLDILARMKTDKRKRQLFTPTTTFQINNINYDPIGPVCLKYYGYTFQLTIGCPFGFTVDSATWTDIA